MLVTTAVTGGGAEVAMQRLQGVLVSSGVRTLLVGVNRSADQKQVEGFNNCDLGRNHGSGFFSILRASRRLRHLIDLHQPCVLIVNCELVELIVSLIAKKHLPRLIVVEHTTRPWTGRKILGWCVRLRLYLLRVDWVKVSQRITRIWPFSNNAHLISNMVNSTSGPQLQDAQDPAPFVFVGRLSEEKQPLLILKAVEALGSTIDIFGDGDLRELISNEYKKCARLHGFVPDPWRTISQGQLLLVASEYEGDGLVVVEGILAGLPILLSDVPDLRYFGLPDEHYFGTYEELVLKMNDFLDGNVAKYFPPESKLHEIRLLRDPNYIAQQWLSLIT